MIPIKIGKYPPIQLSDKEAKAILYEILFMQGLDSEKDRGIIQVAETLANALDIEIEQIPPTTLADIFPKLRTN